jgi:hypothetical protein
MTVTDEEVRYICSKTDCPSIKQIRVFNRDQSPNAITHQGMLHLAQMRWDSLTLLELGENSLIEALTTSAIKDANNSQRPTYPIWNRLISVK